MVPGMHRIAPSPRYRVSAESRLSYFFLPALFSAFWSVNRTYRQARKQGNQEITNACLCYSVAFIGYVTSIAFLSNAYGFLPARYDRSRDFDELRGPERNLL